MKPRDADATQSRRRREAPKVLLAGRRQCFFATVVLKFAHPLLVADDVLFELEDLLAEPAELFDLRPLAGDHLRLGKLLSQPAASRRVRMPLDAVDLTLQRRLLLFRCFELLAEVSHGVAADVLYAKPNPTTSANSSPLSHPGV